MKKLSLSIFIAAIMISSAYNCKSEDITTSGKGAKKMEGWAGPPEDPNKTPYNYYYMRVVGAASDKAIASKRSTQMEDTCQDAAKLSAKDNIIGKMKGEEVKGASGSSDGQSTGKVIIREFEGNVKGINVADCKPRGKNPDKEWEECECVAFIVIDGGREAFRAAVTAPGGGK